MNIYRQVNRFKSETTKAKFDQAIKEEEEATRKNMDHNFEGADFT
jgi:hypothetical protein